MSDDSPHACKNALPWLSHSIAEAALATDLQTNPANTVARSYAQLGVTDWAGGHKPGHRSTHAYDLADCGLTPGHVREAFSEYPGTYDRSA